MLSGAGPLRLILGIALIFLGGVWILQGLDVLGQDGGMNGQGIWTVIGALVALAGIFAVFTWLQTRRRI